MFNGNCGAKRIRHQNHGFKSSGNVAFDNYKAETLKRLQDEQDAFETFLDRLRAAKDKAEFDQFMEERAKSAKADSTDEPNPEADPA